MESEGEVLEEGQVDGDDGVSEVCEREKSLKRVENVAIFGILARKEVARAPLMATRCEH